MAKAAPQAKAKAKKKSVKDRSSSVRSSSSLKVRALTMGFYNHARRREGDVFTLVKASDFSTRWMDWVDRRTPEKITGPKEALQKHHDEILVERAAKRKAAAADDPLGAND